MKQASASVYALACVYLVVGIYFSTNTIPKWYFALVLYVSLKLVFNYRKCTLSYIEVKARGVRKEEGYLYNLLEAIVDVRYDPFLLIIIMVFNALIVYECVQYENFLNYLWRKKKREMGKGFFFLFRIICLYVLYHLIFFVVIIFTK